MEVAQIFKDLFIQLLQNNNVTAYKLSKDTGITEGLISQWKSGRQLPKYDSLKILCDYFNVSADYLLELLPEENL
ncbi:MAG: helix-turn-helix transcriptional regulator [bacterium]|nr:helix-turn-helix transcriptional regulator [bacterium]